MVYVDKWYSSKSVLHELASQSRQRWGVSPECSCDGVCQPEATKAAEVQREAVVMGGRRDWNFGSWDADRWCFTFCCSSSMILLLHGNLQIRSWTHEQTQSSSSWFLVRLWIWKWPVVFLASPACSLPFWSSSSKLSASLSVWEFWGGKRGEGGEEPMCFMTGEELRGFGSTGGTGGRLWECVWGPRPSLFKVP